MKLTAGQTAPLFITKDIWGNTIDLSKVDNKKILLSFLRYAECAVCQLRVSEIMRERKIFLEKNIGIIAIFQSPAENVKLNISDKTHFDFTVIADPDRVLYNLYHVKPSWYKMIKTTNLKGIKRVMDAIKMGFKPGGKVEGYFHQIPADFILDQNKNILVAKYGNNAIDHIPLANILEGA